MAKKMNKRLCEYKYGKDNLPDWPDNSWNPKDWEKELDIGNYKFKI
jgi:hypothetical protein